jgi:hypothetical protein
MHLLAHHYPMTVWRIISQWESFQVWFPVCHLTNSAERESELGWVPMQSIIKIKGLYKATA